MSSETTNSLGQFANISGMMKQDYIISKLFYTAAKVMASSRV